MARHIVSAIIKMDIHVHMFYDTGERWKPGWTETAAASIEQERSVDVLQQRDIGWTQGTNQSRPYRRQRSMEFSERFVCILACYIIGYYLVNVLLLKEFIIKLADENCINEIGWKNKMKETRKPGKTRVMNHDSWREVEMNTTEHLLPLVSLSL